MKVKDYVLTFMKYTFIINLIMFVILYLYNANKEFILSVSLEDIGFILKYMIISFVLAIIVPVVDEYLRKFISDKGKYYSNNEKFVLFKNKGVSDTYISNMKNSIYLKYRNSRLILENNYYKYLFK